jgi:hypothetical protein
MYYDMTWTKYVVWTVVLTLCAHTQLIMSIGRSMCQSTGALAVDMRQCELCARRGDAAASELMGRLLNMDAGRWVHVNCALWSSEVYETVSGALINCDVAVIRGMLIECLSGHRNVHRCDNVVHPLQYAGCYFALLSTTVRRSLSFPVCSRSRMCVLQGQGECVCARACTHTYRQCIAPSTRATLPIQAKCCRVWPCFDVCMSSVKRIT